VLLYDSDDSGPENEEMQNSGTGTASAADEIHLYSDGNFDCCDEKGDPILPLAFWKSHNTHFPNSEAITNRQKRLCYPSFAEQKWTSVQCCRTHHDGPQNNP